MTFLTRIGLANKSVIVLLTLVLIGVGLFSMTALRQDLLPSFTNPAGTVFAAYPGASPTAVEAEVTRPLESALRSVPGVTSVESTSGSSMSQITVIWDFDEDSKQMAVDLRSAMDSVELPENVEPSLFSGGLEMAPVVYLAVSSDKPPAELAQELQTVGVPKLSELEGVRSVEITGQEVREVVITERPADADRLNADLSQLQSMLPMYQAPMPAGAVTEGGQEKNVQTGFAIGTVEQLQNLQLQTADGPVALSAVADVVDVPKPVTSIARVNGEPSLGLMVMKNQDANTVSVSHAVAETLPELQDEIGGDLKFETVFDQAPFIEQSVHDLAVEGGLGLVMAVLVILVFLRAFKPTIITAISIPLSLLIALIALYYGEYTLNMLTLSALTVAVGRVVDDSIVVIENIERHRDMGEAFDSKLIVGAVREVAGAVTSSTLTTAAVFLPLGLVSGSVGELFRPFALTVMVALLASLVVSLTIVPVLASWFMKPRTKPYPPQQQARRDAKAAKHAEAGKARAAAEAQRDLARRQKEHVRATRKYEKKERAYLELISARGLDEQSTAAALAGFRRDNPPPVPPTEQAAEQVSAHRMHDSAETGLQRWYLPSLRWSLRHPVITLVAAVLIFVLTMGMSTLLKTDFIGDAGQTSLQVSTEMPPGTDLATTDAATRKIEAVLADDPAVKSYQTTVGGDGFGGAASANSAAISVTLESDAKGAEVSQELRTKLGELTDVGEVRVMTADGSTGSSQLAVQLTGTDDQALATASQQVVDMMNEIDGLEEVQSDLAEQQTVLQVDVNEPLAAQYGMSQGTVGLAVRSAIDGTQLGTMTVDDASRDIFLRSGQPVTTKAELENLQLPVTQKQTMDAQQEASDEMRAEAEAKAEEQFNEALEQLDESEATLRSSRRELARQIALLNDQLTAVRRGDLSALSGGSGGSGGMGGMGGAGLAAPSDPTGGMGTGGMGGAGGMDPAALQRAQQEAAIEQLTGSISQLQEQLEQLDEQIAAVDEQRRESREANEEAKQTQARQEAIQDLEGTPIRLSQIATVTEVPTPASITRIDGSRAVTVNARSTGDDLGAATRSLMTGLDGLTLPAGVTASLGGASQEQSDAFSQLFLAMGVAIAMVYIIMVATFRSLMQPLILLVSVPFAATGAILLLLITDTPMGVPAMIGLLMLIGIVVTNAIVLIDLVNQFREQGASIDDAVIHGARLRLRPIIMTALATIMALVPMGLGLTGGGIFISKPLAIVVIGGLISSTALTLLLVPVLYHLVEHFRARLAGRGRRSTTPQIEDEDPGLDGLDGLLKPGPAT